LAQDDTVIKEPASSDFELPRWLDRSAEELDGPYIVILYNDDYHGMDEVIMQLQRATGYDIGRCVAIMVEAHTNSRAIAFSGSQEQCERCAAILRQIRLQVETDKA
jgi:ATP-dependent Clp protease adapter protein ClpS